MERRGNATPRIETNDLVKRELTQLNRNKPISVLIHGWIGPAGSVVEHWAQQNDVAGAAAA
jgi:hypothetical protein